MLPAVYLALIVAMALLGWIATVSKTRAFWLFWGRGGRFWVATLIGDAVEQAYRRFERHRHLYLAMKPVDRDCGWYSRSTSRLCRYYAGIPVFKNRVFTLP